MRKTLIGLTILMLVLVNVTAALAEEDSHRQAAERLLALMEMENNINQIMDQMLTAELQQNPQLMLYEDVMRRFFAKYMSWESLREDFVRIYAEEFTEDELNDLIEFYESPTGRKAVEKTPVLVMRGAELGQKRVQDNIPELQRMLEEETERLRELQKKEQQKEQTGEQEQKQ